MLKLFKFGKKKDNEKKNRKEAEPSSASTTLPVSEKSKRSNSSSSGEKSKSEKVKSGICSVAKKIKSSSKSVSSSVEKTVRSGAKKIKSSTTSVSSAVKKKLCRSKSSSKTTSSSTTSESSNSTSQPVITKTVERKKEKGKRSSKIGAMKNGVKKTVMQSVQLIQRPFQKKLEVVAEPEETSLLLRYSAKCFDERIIAHSKHEINHLSAPHASLMSLVYIYLSHDKHGREFMEEQMKMKKKDMKDLHYSVSHLSNFVSPSRYFNLSRVFIGQKHAEISQNFIDSVKETLGDQMIHCIFSKDLEGWIRRETSGKVKMRHLTMLPDEAVGIVAVGMDVQFREDYEISSSYIRAPFATTFHKRQMHTFFTLEGECKWYRNEHLEAWSIQFAPLSSGQSLSLTIVRPASIGDIVRFTKRMNGKELQEVMRELQKAENVSSKLLLPTFHLSNQCKLYEHWLKEEIVPRIPPATPPKGKAARCSNLREIYQLARMRIDAQGIHSDYGIDGKVENPLVSPSQNPRKSTLAVHESYHFRLDSPFVCVVAPTDSLIPLLMGCYAGSPCVRPNATQLRTPTTVKRVVMRKPGEKRSITRDQLLAALCSSVYSLPTIISNLYSFMLPIQGIQKSIRDSPRGTLDRTITTTKSPGTTTILGESNILHY